MYVACVWMIWTRILKSFFFGKDKKSVIIDVQGWVLVPININLTVKVCSYKFAD